MHRCEEGHDLTLGISCSKPWLTLGVWTIIRLSDIVVTRGRVKDKPCRYVPWCSSTKAAPTGNGPRFQLSMKEVEVNVAWPSQLEAS